MSDSKIGIGVDTGGTFTDIIYIDGGKVSTYKCLSTPSNPAEAVLQGLNVIPREMARNIVHGSTVATNAVLERKGVRTALITNRGFEDILEIGRQNRERIYDLKYVKPPPLVPEDLRFGINGRLLYTGEVIQDVDQDEIEKVVVKIRKAGAESVAVCLLFSFTQPDHEKAVETVCERESLSVSASHRILPEFREFERTSTTVLNAYVSPIMKNYISHLTSNLGEEDQLRVMQSNGGSISSAMAMSESIRTILSGPAGGVVGAYEVGRISGFDRLISFDMGGTSTDVSLVDSSVALTTESKISGWPIKVPMIDIHTVGAGGGSIARLDAGGALRVGPESAGADPGPICYGKGDKITVTDANLYLGRLLPDFFLGGEMELEEGKLEKNFSKLAKDTGLSTIEIAEGIIEVANATMEKAIRVISVERGHDPQEFSLVSFGGAGGLHAPFLADLLSIPRVIVPENPGLLSAFGMLLADIVKDYSLTVMVNEDESSFKIIEKLFSPLMDRGVRELVGEGLKRNNIKKEMYLDMRYEGQSHEIGVPFSKGYVEDFHSHHERLYGYKNPDKKVEIVNVRLRMRGIQEKPEICPLEKSDLLIASDAILDTRNVVFRSCSVPTKILDREKLKPGNLMEGPVLIVEYSSTTIVPPGWGGEVDGFKNIVLTRNE
jgi:N-methylhydantoinase A